MRKIYATLSVPVILLVNDGVYMAEFIDTADLNLRSTDDRVEVIDVQIDDYVITDSK